MTTEDRHVADRLADLNTYGKALNRADGEEDVVSLTLEATSVLLSFPYATFVLVRADEAIVADSTFPSRHAGDPAGEAARRALATGETVTITGEAAKGTDGPDVEATAAVPIHVGDEPVAALVTSGPDATDFDEAALRPLEILATHAATALENIRTREQLERTKQSLSARTELVDLYSQLFRHHLRNDLNVISGYVEMIDSSPLVAEDASHLQTVRETVEHSIGLVERVSDLHAVIGDLEGPLPRSLREAIADATEAATDRYSDLSVTFDPADLDYEVYGGHALGLVFENLLQNAVEHNDRPVTVTVRAESPDPKIVVVSVGDDGEGIDESVRETIFELGTAAPESGGLGLGLGFVRRLVEAYGGMVTACESESGGAEFRVSLERV